MDEREPEIFFSNPELIKLHRKPVRVLIQFDNGDVQYIEGKNAQKWLEDLDSVLNIMQLTRQNLLPPNFLDIEWAEVDSLEASKLLKTSVSGQPKSKS